ncbi:MAG: hypothetical protein AAGA83_23865 [Cyanobacteria bacterium P01_F01_bin.116]
MHNLLEFAYQCWLNLPNKFGSRQPKRAGFYKVIRVRPHNAICHQSRPSFRRCDKQPTSLCKRVFIFFIKKVRHKFSPAKIFLWVFVNLSLLLWLAVFLSAIAYLGLFLGD